MQNQVNSQFLPYNAQPSQPAVQTSPTASVGAVNIQIFNPTANPQGFYQPAAYTYPCNYNNLINQAPQAVPAPANVPVSEPVQNTQQMNSDLNNAMNLNNNQQGVAAQGEGENGAKTEEKKPEAPKVTLTDDYIKTLENYLNSPDNKIRLTGAKELLDRFKEDETRKDDAALTALLNKILQDSSETVKFVGLTALDAGYAIGNNETAQILQQMQSANTSYGEDAALASRVLLKMSGYQANAQAAAQNPASLAGTNSKNAVDNKLPNDTGVLLQQNASDNNMVQPMNQAVA